MPRLATFIIAQATSWSRVAWQRGVKPFGGVFKKSAGRVWKEKAEKRVRPWLERRHPLISGLAGGPGAYEAELKKRTTKEQKKIEGRNAKDLRKIFEMRPLSTEDRHRKAAAMGLLAEKKKLDDVKDRRYFLEAKTYGTDVGKILKAMPHWAPDIGKITREVIKKEMPREFRRKTQPEALEKAEVFLSMDLRKLKDIRMHGSTAQKDAVRELLRTSANRQAIYDAQDRIRAQIAAATTTKKRAEFREDLARAQATYLAAARSPTFNPRRRP